MTVNIEIGIGEAFDRLSILAIKKTEITDYEKNKNVSVEHDYLLKKLKKELKNQEAFDLYMELSKVNRTLWDIEDQLRQREKIKKFDSVFIELARSVYSLNDSRAAIKKKVNLFFGSRFVEEKSYAEY